MERAKHYSHFKDLHKGETCIVVANGPSLKEVPVEFLRRYVTLGCNRISMMTETHGFAPTYYACMGWNQVDTPEKRETFWEMLDHPDCKAAFINRMWAHEFPYENVYTILGGRYYGVEPVQTKGFSYDPLHVSGLGYTMVFVLLQIAYYMGFETVLLVGLDHHYPEGPQKHFYSDDDYPQFEVAPGPVYNFDNEEWKRGADAVLRLCEAIYERNGRDIINLTGETRCTVFRKESLSDWLDKS